MLGWGLKKGKVGFKPTVEIALNQLHCGGGISAERARFRSWLLCTLHIQLFTFDRSSKISSHRFFSSFSKPSAVGW